MNLSFHTALLAGVAFALIAMFGAGLYWLSAKGRSTRQHPPVSPPPARSSAFPSATFDVDYFDECEASALYPEHVMRAAHEAAPQSHAPYPPLGPHEDPIRSSLTSEVGLDLHDALESLKGKSGSQEPPPTTPVAASSPGPMLHCPRCLSPRVDTRNRARKAGSTIGSVAGATGGMAAALAGAETGAVVGSIAGPIGTVFGGLAGAVIAGLVGSAAGCAAGSAVGGAIDDNVLENYVCLACSHTFSATQH